MEVMYGGSPPLHTRFPNVTSIIFPPSTVPLFIENAVFDQFIHHRVSHFTALTKLDLTHACARSFNSMEALSLACTGLE